MSKIIIAIIIILILLICIYYNTLRFGPYNTQSVQYGTERYKVHNAHSDVKAAAALMANINSRNEKLINFLQEKYSNTSPKILYDPNKNNRIDVISGTEMYAHGDINAHDVVEQLRSPLNREYLQERIAQLVRNYSPSRIYEISPKNTGDATSYTEDKRTLVLCLRHKKPNIAGEYELHDINTMMFVVLHELAHMMNNTWNHKRDFWVLFKFLLLNATESGIYQPVDYAKYPINYCGLWLKYNPIYDQRI
jgi:predicted metal-dependent hydrolase